MGDDLVVILHPVAKQEIRRAVAYYRGKGSGLGRALLGEIEALKTKLIANPLRCGLLEDPYRCCRLERFPYGLIYLAEERHIFGIAFTHLKRRPGHWKARFDRP